MLMQTKKYLFHVEKYKQHCEKQKLTKFNKKDFGVDYYMYPMPAKNLELLTCVNKNIMIHLIL